MSLLQRWEITRYYQYIDQLSGLITQFFRGKMGQGHLAFFSTIKRREYKMTKAFPTLRLALGAVLLGHWPGSASHDATRS